MPTSTITLNGTDLTLVELPGVGFRSVDWNVEDAVSSTKATYTGQTQTFEWPGGEEWYGTCELPLLDAAGAAKWRAFLMQCRGILNPFLMGDPLNVRPMGRISGRSTPVVLTPSSEVNKPMSKYLRIGGLEPNIGGLLHAGTYLQVGYRLLTLMDDLKAAGDGTATVEVWPSLREQPPNNAPIILNNPRGLFRLATNKRSWSYDETRLSSMSVPVMEYR